MTIGVSARADTKKAAKAIEKLEDKIERGLVAAMAAAVNAGYRSLKGTSSFQDRTWALRDSFLAHADETSDGEFYVKVDESVGGRAPGEHPTPPSVYGRYVNWGTSRISPRLFAEEAREEMIEKFEQRLQRLFATKAPADLGADEQ